jgi:hypothetical protein
LDFPIVSCQPLGNEDGQCGRQDDGSKDAHGDGVEGFGMEQGGSQFPAQSGPEARRRFHPLGGSKQGNASLDGLVVPRAPAASGNVLHHLAPERQVGDGLVPKVRITYEKIRAAH